MEGRSGALERLSRELAAATDGKRLALVGGEPGIGKTRLVSEFAARAHGGGCTVLYGRSSDGPDPPYGPFAEALGQYLRHAPEALEGEGAAELARLVPETRKSTGGPGPEPAPPPAAGPEQFVLFGAVASLLERASAGSTLLFVLEDLHWADEGTMLLLRHLLTGAASTSALFLGTYRPTDVEPDSPSAHSLAALIREETSRIDLEPLSRDEAFELLERLAGHGLGGSEAELANALHAESAGNPLFLTELVRTLLESGSIRQDDGGWRVDAPGDTPLPTTLAEVIRQRVAELGSEAADALGAASVSGLEFDPELVERAIGRQPGELGSAWDAAERAALVMETESGQLAFNHPLVERTLYKGLGSRRRGALHRRIAEELEASDGRGQETELARHWSKAVPADPKMAELWAARAGDRALEQLDGDAAAAWYRRALELGGSGGDGGERRRCELLLGLGEAERLSGDPRFRETLLEASRLADRLADNRLLVDAALLNSRSFASVSGGIDQERVAMLEAALRATGEADSRERALLLATLATELSFTDDPEQRRRLSDEAVETARRVGDRAALAYVLTTRFGAIWLPETLEERLANTAEAVRLADELGDPWAQFQAVHWHFMGLVQAGRFEGTASLLERLEALAQRMGDPTTRWITAYDRATVAIVAGRLDAAEELANEALALATDSGPANPLPLFVSQLTAIRYEQGRLAELQPLMAKAVSESPGIPGLRAFLALSYVEADLHDKARELLATEAETDFAEVPRGTTWLLALTIYGHVAADLGDRPTAASLYERLAPFHEQVAYAGVTAWCFVDHVLGRLATVLGKFEDAERHLEKALDRSIRTGAPLWTARAQLDTARMLLARDAPGDRGRAVEPLEEAIAWAGRVGAATVERRARSLRDHRQAMDAAAEAGPTGQRLRIGGRPSPDAEAPDQDEEATESTGRLERKGDFWLLRLAEAEVRLRDGKGVRYLARLLADPGVELHAADLQQGYADAAPATTTGSAVEAGLSVRGGGTEDAGDVLDAEAKRSYRARIDELREEIEEAEDFNDPERAAKAREELEFIGRELAGAVGIGGRDRKAASQAERARVNVTRAIRATIRRVADNDERLGRHLEMSVRTGSFCSYQPDPGHAVEWRIAEGST